MQCLLEDEDEDGKEADGGFQAIILLCRVNTCVVCGKRRSTSCIVAGPEPFCQQHNSVIVLPADSNHGVWSDEGVTLL